MTDIRNIQGKLVCRVDKASKSVEIVVKGCITVIRFSDDGKVNVTNTQKAV
jgi:CRP-like cAMP-binding protein